MSKTYRVYRDSDDYGTIEKAARKFKGSGHKKSRTKRAIQESIREYSTLSKEN